MADATRTIETILTSDDDTKSGFTAAGKGARVFADGTIGHFKRIGGAVLNLQNLLAGSAAFLAAKSVFDPAIEMETFTIQFETLLGSLDLAEERLKFLSDFAAATPFELPQLAQASRVLQTLAGPALATGEGLRMVGDVAASVSADVAELSIWFGRLYDGIQSGRPVGEALARLQELGVISGKVRGKLEDLQKTGAAGAEVWAVVTDAMAKYEGGMEKLSRTTAGRISTLKDNWKTLRREVGEVALPALNDAIEETMKKIEELGDSGKLQDLGRALGATINGLVKLVEFVIQNGEALKNLGFSYVAITILRAAQAALIVVKAEIVAIGAASVTTSGGVGAMNVALLGTKSALGVVGLAAATAFLGWNLGKLLVDLDAVSAKIFEIGVNLGYFPGNEVLAEAMKPGRQSNRVDAITGAARRAPDPSVTPATEADLAAQLATENFVDNGPEPADPGGDALLVVWRKQLADATKLRDERLKLEKDAAAEDAADLMAQARRDAAAQNVRDLLDAGRDLDAAARDAEKLAADAWDKILNPDTNAERRADRRAERQEAKFERSLAKARAKQEDGRRLSKPQRALLAADDLRANARNLDLEAARARTEAETERSLATPPDIPGAPAGRSDGVETLLASIDTKLGVLTQHGIM